MMEYRLSRKYSRWERLYCDEMEVDGKTIKECDWRFVDITDVPLNYLLNEWECLLIELSRKEVDLAQTKEMYNAKEFEIVYMSDIDFKALYGSTSEKVRKQHASNELKQLKDKQNDLELSIQWIKSYLPFLREAIRLKGE